MSLYFCDSLFTSKRTPSFVDCPIWNIVFHLGKSVPISKLIWIGNKIIQFIKSSTSQFTTSQIPYVTLGRPLLYTGDIVFNSPSLNLMHPKILFLNEAYYEGRYHWNLWMMHDMNVAKFHAKEKGEARRNNEHWLFTQSECSLLEATISNRNDILRVGAVKNYLTKDGYTKMILDNINFKGIATYRILKICCFLI